LNPKRVLALIGFWLVLAFVGNAYLIAKMNDWTPGEVLVLVVLGFFAFGCLIVAFRPGGATKA